MNRKSNHIKIVSAFILLIIVLMGGGVSMAQKKPAPKHAPPSSSAKPKPNTNSKTSANSKTNSAKKGDATPDPAAPPPVAEKKKFSIPVAYHSLTNHYNYWYNANMKMDLAVERLKDGNTDDYTKILPLYDYDTEGASSSVGGDMDEVVKKTSVGIQLHENSRWVPDCYLLMGKAYYFKKEYQNALDVFQFIQTNYKIKVVKGVAAPEGKLAHKSITNDGMLWLIKTYVMMGKYDEAEAITKDVEARKEFPAKYKDELKVLHTYVLIKKENYKDAAPQLINAIALTKKKSLKTRYTFILAQIYEEGKNNSDAIRYYKQVLKMDPDFVMDFNTRMKIVQLYSSQPNMPANEVRSLLYGMLNNSKYNDYKDQVYYQLAELELKQKNEKGGISYLRQSIAASTINVAQKGLSNKRLAEIYFNRPAYILAKNRYDSTALYLPTTHPDYPEVKERKEILTEVVTRIHIIQKEDSLQKLAGMKPAELERKFEKAIAKAAQKKLQDSLDNLSNNKANTDNSAAANNQGASSSFYFYNPSVKGSGYTDFVKKWGNRPVVDDWRRSRKNQKGNAGGDDDKNAATTKTEEEKSTAKNTELEKMMADVPTTDAKLKASDDKIINAYFELGNLYKQQLKNNKKAIETFEKLVSRYPKNKYIQECYYLLYLLYDQQKNYQLSETYKQKILNEFPNSNFAKALKDPNFQNDKSKKEKDLTAYYESTYNSYLDEKYTDVIKRCDDADKQFLENPLKAKFDLLKALAIGKTGELPEFTASLNKIIAAYPGTDVKTKAQEILTAINNMKKGNTADFKPEEKDKKEAAPGITYAYAANSAHFCLVVFNKINAKNATVIGQLSNFNSTNHSLDNLNVTQQMLNTETQMAVVQTFPSADKANEFLDELTDNKSTIFKGIAPEDYFILIISQTNYSLLTKDGDIENYRNFYEEKYISGQ